MAESGLLANYGLHRNPFTDRTAENTSLDVSSFYMHSDLQGFSPSETTYLFFGKRGSGKTTIRMQMQNAYRAYNAKHPTAQFFLVDLCSPGHLTACLRNFQSSTANTDALDAWDAHFAKTWTCDDLVDAILSYAATKLLDLVSAPNSHLLDALRASPKASRQFLIFTQLYAQTDTPTLHAVRAAILAPPDPSSNPRKIHPAAIAVPAALLLATTTTLLITKSISSPSPTSTAHDPKARAHPIKHTPAHHLEDLLDALASSLQPLASPASLASLAATSALSLSLAAALSFRARKFAAARAALLTSPIRVVNPTAGLASLLAELLPGRIYSADEAARSAREIQALYIGVSPFQKLQRLNDLLRAMGYEGVAVFGDSFDEVTLLDPVKFPMALKSFAKQVCRNDFLSFGRLHFFFPDSRIALDLNTDQVLKEARFDRHFVRDLTWSRHQLRELAERRFRAAQMQENGKIDEAQMKNFHSMFEKVSTENLSSALSKIATPRELMIMMTELLARMEAAKSTDGGYIITATDVEVAVQRAQEQAI